MILWLIPVALLACGGCFWVGRKQGRKTVPPVQTEGPSTAPPHQGPSRYTVTLTDGTVIHESADGSAALKVFESTMGCRFTQHDNAGAHHRGWR